MANQQIKVDITPSAQPAPIVYCSQGDVGRVFEVQLYDGAAKYTIPTGASIEVVGKKADKNVVEITGGLSWGSDGLVTITTQEQLTACAGPVVCEIRVVQGSTVLGSANFVLYCEGGTQDGPYSESVLPMLARAEHAAETVEADITRAETAAQTATTAASNAQTYAIQANTAATNAATSKENASRSADEAGASASAASQSQTAAASSASAAHTSEENAADSAEAALLSAADAHTDKQSALSSANNAQSSAEAAAQSASQAQSRATQAQTWATAASEAAQEAQTYGLPWQTLVTIPASGWSNHRVTLTLQKVNASSRQEILPLPMSFAGQGSYTEASILANNQALSDAVLYDDGQATDSISLYAVNVPTVDLQVIVQIYGYTRS